MTFYEQEQTTPNSFISSRKHFYADIYLLYMNFNFGILKPKTQVPCKYFPII